MKRIFIFVMTVMVVFGFILSAGAVNPGSAPLVLAANVGPSFATSAPEMPTVEMPIVTKDTRIRVSGTFTLSANVPISEFVVIAGQAIFGQLRIVDGTGTASFFDVFFDVTPDKSFPNRFAFRTVIEVKNLQGNFSVDGTDSATLFMDARLNPDPKSSPAPAPPISLGHFTAGVYVEETSARFVPYVSWLAEPRPDPKLPVLTLP